MLENVKSIYIVKHIFSYVIATRKFNIFKFNKSWKDKIDINIKEYLFVSGKYILYEEKGKGKEYELNNFNIIYEGEYLNGKRHGKGKEYNVVGKIKFEGEYLNGKRNGNGKEYKSDGKIIFEGEYLNGKRNGKGKEY